VTVRELFTAYIDDMKRSGKRSWKHTERILLSETVGAAQAIGADRPAAEIEASDVVPLLAEIHGRGAIVMANQTRAYLGAAFAFGLRSANDYTRQGTGADWGLNANPILAIKSDETANRTRDRYLAPAEFRKFWHWLVEYDQMSSLPPALRLMMATGQRAEEILRITASSYLQPQGLLVWDKTKNGTPALGLDSRGSAVTSGSTAIPPPAIETRSRSVTSVLLPHDPRARSDRDVQVGVR
jgi:integrase